MVEFENVVDRIYEVPAAPQKWPGLLHDLSGIVGAKGGILIARRQDSWLGGCASPGVIHGADAFLHSDIGKRSKASMRLVAANRPGFVADYELFTDEELTSDPFYTEWAAPNGTHHGAATAILIPNGDIALIQVQRAKGEPALDRGTLDLLDTFRPHLARAAMLTARWRLERLRAAAEALALIGLPAAVLSLDGRVLTANSLFQLLSDYVVWLPRDQVALTDAAATALLRQAVASIGDPAAPAVRSFPAKGKAPGKLAVVHLVPMTGQARELFDGGFGVLVVTPLGLPAAPAAALLQGLFDLTPAEARVACGITEGLTVEQIAERYAVAYTTVRTQVNVVFAKTGTNRQSQVASLLAGLPRIPLR